MSKIFIDVKGQKCPIPLIEMRKAVKKANKGDIIEIEGTHVSSKSEIPMAVKSLGLKIVNIDEKENIWKITIEV